MASRMRSPRCTQRGASLWQLIVVIAVAGFFVLVALKVIPLYLNELKVATAVREVAQTAGLNADASVHAIRRSLGRHWEIDNIEDIRPDDIDIIRNDDGGTTLAWDYEARVRLFYNVSVVIHFKGSKLMRDAG